MNNVFLFPQKTQQNLQTTKSNQDIFSFSKFFKQAKKKLKILRPTWLSPSGFCVQNIVALLSTFADSNFSDFCGFLSAPLKSSRK